MAHLRVSSADGPVEHFVLGGERVVVGRATECDLVLPDILLSRRHAEIERRPDGWWARDLGSLNGTRLNGTRIEGERPLQPGDVLALAGWRIELRDGDAPPGSDAGTASRLRDVTELATRSDVGIGAIARQNRVLGVLTRAAGAIVASPTAEELLDRLLEHLLDAVRARAGAVAFLDDPRPQLAAARAREGPPPRALPPGVADQVARVRTAFLTPDAAAADGTPCSLLCAPLWFSATPGQPDRLAGCVVLEAAAAPTPFVEEDLKLVTAVANLASSRLESLRLREENADKRRLDEDVRGAARIQASLLPDEVPAMPGWEIAGSTRLCSEVGGDYYDFAHEQGALLVALGDVAGKGLAAALLMATLRGAVRALWRGSDHLPEIVARVNRHLCDSVPENRYATLLLARIDTAGGEIAWVNAGHAPPLLVRAGGAYETLAEGGTILGTFREAAWSEGRSAFGRGDVLLLCSDGVLEAARLASGPLEPRSLAAAVKAHEDAPASTLLAALQAKADETLGGARRADDHTFLVVKRQR